MSDRHSMARELFVDGAKGAPVAGYFGALAGGMTMADWASLAAFVYTAILIIEKLVKLRVLQRCWAFCHQHWPRPAAPAPRPPGRHPEDE